MQQATERSKRSGQSALDFIGKEMQKQMILHRIKNIPNIVHVYFGGDQKKEMSCIALLGFLYNSTARRKSNCQSATIL